MNAVLRFRHPDYITTQFPLSEQALSFTAHTDYVMIAVIPYLFLLVISPGVHSLRSLRPKLQASFGANTNLRLLRFDLGLKVLRDFALRLVMMLAPGGLSVSLGSPPGRGVGGGAGAGERASLRLAPQPLVGGTGGRRQRRGPRPLGPGADLR